MRHSVTLYSAQQGHTELRSVWEFMKPWLIGGHRLTVSIKTETRSTAQNSILWSILSDVSKQVEWHGQKLDDEAWKDMATAALKRQRVVPGIDGGFVVLGTRTSKMTVAEMSELIEFLHAFGDERGVRWSRTSLGRDVPDEAVCE